MKLSCGIPQTVPPVNMLTKRETEKTRPIFQQLRTSCCKSPGRYWGRTVTTNFLVQHKRLIISSKAFAAVLLCGEEIRAERNVNAMSEINIVVGYTFSSNLSGSNPVGAGPEFSSSSEFGCNSNALADGSSVSQSVGLSLESKLIIKQLEK